jgi:hypothetical protein
MPMPPPHCAAVLPLIVLLAICSVPVRSQPKMPPPLCAVLLPLTVLPNSVMSPSLKMPPPPHWAVLPLIVLA